MNITSLQQVHGSVNPFFRGDPFFEEFFRTFVDPRPRTTQSLGTGVLIDREGHVLTNEHVLAGATQILVTLGDGRELEGELIGADPATDLAVVGVKAEGPLPVAPLGVSSEAMIGETVIAIGNPFGLHHTVTTGVLSAQNRSVRSREREYHGFLQTDASINPGNSGGPLVNLDGEVIGINTVILGDAQGIGFAIPIDRARRVIDDLIRHGELPPVWLGLRLQELEPEPRGPGGKGGGRGALVSHVFGRSPASEADVRPGDLVVELDGTRIDGARAYFEVLRGLTEGDRARLVFERGERRMEASLRVEILPVERAEELATVLLGLYVRERPGAGGLVIEEVVPDSPADLRGLRPGDLILRVDRQPVQDLAAFRRAIAQIHGRTRVLLLVQRGRTGYQVPLGLS